MPEVSPGSSPAEMIVRDGSQVERVYVALAGETTWLFHEGVTYEIVEQTRGHRRSGAHESLTAPMPATVVAVRVAVGDQVARGDILILLEAMKMELPVRAPEDGRVTAVHCRAGDLIPSGAPLLELE